MVCFEAVSASNRYIYAFRLHALRKCHLCPEVLQVHAPKLHALHTEIFMSFGCVLYQVQRIVTFETMIVEIDGLRIVLVYRWSSTHTQGLIRRGLLKDDGFLQIFTREFTQRRLAGCFVFCLVCYSNSIF